MKFTIMVHPSLVNITLYSVFLKLQKKYYLATPSTWTPVLGVMTFTQLSTAVHLVSVDHACEYSRRYFKKYIDFSFFPHEITPFGLGSCEICHFLSTYLEDATYHICSRLTQSFWKNLNARRMTIDANPKQKVTWVSDSGDLNMSMFTLFIHDNLYKSCSLTVVSPSIMQAFTRKNSWMDMLLILCYSIH